MHKPRFWYQSFHALYCLIVWQKSRLFQGTFAHLAFLCQKRKTNIGIRVHLRKNQSIMEVKIKYQDIIDRCEKLSSFEADGKFDANGESRYLDIHINEVDRLLVMDYVKQAQSILEERIERMIEITEDRVTQMAYPFDRIISGEHGDYESYVIDSKSIVDKEGLLLSFHKGEQKFVYESTYMVDGKLIAYTNPEMIGRNYIFDKTTQQYYQLKDSGKVYTWSEDGTSLKEFDGELIAEGFTWILKSVTRWNGIKAFTKHVNEAIVSYAMAAWLRGKLDERVPFYENLFNNTLAMAVKNIFTKQAP
jgi:hypothetical protein